MDAEFSEDLLFVTTAVVSRETCSAKYQSIERVINATEMCVGTEDGGIGACFGKFQHRWILNLSVKFG